MSTRGYCSTLSQSAISRSLRPRSFHHRLAPSARYSSRAGYGGSGRWTGHWALARNATGIENVYTHTHTHTQSRRRSFLYVPNMGHTTRLHPFTSTSRVIARNCHKAVNRGSDTQAMSTTAGSLYPRCAQSTACHVVLRKSTAVFTAVEAITGQLRDDDKGRACIDTCSSAQVPLTMHALK